MADRVTPETFAHVVAKFITDQEGPEDQFQGLVAGLSAFRDALIQDGQIQPPEKCDAFLGYMEIREILEAAWNGNKWKARFISARYMDKFPDGTFTVALKIIKAKTEPAEKLVIRNPVTTRREFCVQCRTTRTFILEPDSHVVFVCAECKNQQTFDR